MVEVLVSQHARSGEFFKSLHGLRGLMALCVVAFHFSPTLGAGSFRLEAFGYAAVDVFFILSGFVLAHKHTMRFYTLSWRQTGVFLLQRWWRTYPLYAVTMALSLGVMWVLHRPDPSAQQLAVALLLLEGWALPGIGLNTPVWSLGVEWLGYLAFPLIAWTCARPFGAQLRLIALGLVLMAEVLLLSHLEGVLDVTQGLGAVVRMAGGFVAGCILASLPAPSEAPRRRNDVVMLTVCAVTVALLTFAPLYGVPFLTLVVWGAISPGPLVEAFLASRIALYLGRISFALYLCHFPVLVLALSWQSALHLPPTAATLLGVVASFAVAHLLCRFVEEPAIRWWRARARTAAALEPV